MKVFDGVLSDREVESIKSHLLSDEFPWYFAPNVTHRDHKYFDPAFYHHFMHGNEFADLICRRIGFAAPRHARSCLQLPNAANSDMIEGLHVDRYLEAYEPHVVVLYYVTDADGPTVLTDRHYPETTTAPTEYKVTNLIEPKAGKILVFDGACWHTSIKPKRHLRCIINIHVPKYSILEI